MGVGLQLASKENRTDKMFLFRLVFSLLKKKEWGIFSREVPDVGPSTPGCGGGVYCLRFGGSHAYL